MREDIQATINDHELLFWGGHEFSQGSPLVYELTVDGKTIGGEHFDPQPVAYRDGFLIARRAKGFGLYGFAVEWFDPKSQTFLRFSGVRPYLSLRSAGDDEVIAATIGFGDGAVRNIRISRRRNLRTVINQLFGFG